MSGLSGWGALALCAFGAAWGCGDGDESARAHVLMDPSRATSLYDAPFPADDLLGASGVDVSGFPNPEQATIVEQARALVHGRQGFSTTAGVFFRVSEAIDPTTLPSMQASVQASASAYIIGIDADAPDYGRRYPIDASFEAVGGLYAASNLIALVPLQGVPLRARTRYAAVVTTDIRTPQGQRLAAANRADLMDVAALEEVGIDVAAVAGATAFTTADPTAELFAVRDAALARGVPDLDAPFARTDVFDDYCVYQTTLAMPDYQSGVPPYRTEGGQWQFEAGVPVFQKQQQATVVVTVPRTAVPAAGFPLAVFVRTGGGGNRPLVDRGTRGADGVALEAGEGPARYFARAGFAGLQVDGPLGGLRNLTNGDEQFLMFNVQNLGALRDNVRQSAVELSVIARVAMALSFDASDCPAGVASGTGPGSVTFDAAHFALMGHSMGATIAPLTLAIEPLYGAVILSGAGGSWIENIVYKRKPLEVAPVVGLLIKQGFDVRTNDPVLSLAQWALEPADPPVYGAAAVGRHVLMHQGIVDNYILPRIANATSLSMGLDLAGGALDDSGDPRLDGQSPLAPLLAFTGRGSIELPATSNVDGVATAVVVQHLEDGVEDGHEVVFQTDAPKQQYQTFLASWLRGVPVVPVAE